MTEGSAPDLFLAMIGSDKYADATLRGQSVKLGCCTRDHQLSKVTVTAAAGDHQIGEALSHFGMISPGRAAPLLARLGSAPLHGGADANKEDNDAPSARSARTPGSGSTRLPAE
jgi:hypothetical protein